VKYKFSEDGAFNNQYSGVNNQAYKFRYSYEMQAPRQMIAERLGIKVKQEPSGIHNFHLILKVQ
jgi:hypothetical protein